MADQLLAKAILPPHASPTTATGSALAGPFEEPATPNLVDVGRVWSVPLPPADAVTFEASHVPAGFICDLSGSTGDGTVAVGERLADLPAGVASAQLLVAVAPARPGWALVRADAQVVYRPSRDPHATVAASETFARVARAGPSGQAATVDLGDPSVVAHLRDAINALPVAVPGESSCPAFRVGYTAAFAPSRGAAPDLVATTGPCDTVSITVGETLLPTALSDTGGSVAGLLSSYFGPA